MSIRGVVAQAEQAVFSDRYLPDVRFAKSGAEILRALEGRLAEMRTEREAFVEKLHSVAAARGVPVPEKKSRLDLALEGSDGCETISPYGRPGDSLDRLQDLIAIADASLEHYDRLRRNFQPDQEYVLRAFDLELLGL